MPVGVGQCTAQQHQGKAPGVLNLDETVFAPSAMLNVPLPPQRAPRCVGECGTELQLRAMEGKLQVPMRSMKVLMFLYGLRRTGCERVN